MQKLSIVFLLTAALWLSTILGAHPALAQSTAAPPSNVQVEITSFDTARFSWDTPTDEVLGLPTEYRLFVDDTFISQGSYTAFSIGGRFAKDIEYTFSVQALYAGGVTSALAEFRFSITGYTVSDLRAEVYSQSAAELFWDRERFFSSSLLYEVFRDGQLLAKITGNSFFDDTLVPGNNYRYEVVISERENTSDAAIVDVRTPSGIPGDGGDSGGGSSCSTLLSINSNVISWPDDGWYQVQDSGDYTSICEGGSQCRVSDGSYNVINLSTGLRCENVMVNAQATDPGGNTSDTAGPRNVMLTHYSSTAAELFWTNSGNNIIATEVYRDDILLGVSDGTSFYDDTRNIDSAHRYSLVAIDSDNRKSDVVYVGGIVESLQLSHPNGTSFSRTEVSISQNTLVVGSPADDNEFGRSAGSVYLYEKNADNEWQFTQELLPPGGADSREFGSTVKLDENLLLVRGDSPLLANGSVQYIEQVYIYEKDDANQWVLSQTLVGTLPDGRIYSWLGDSFDVDGNTLFIGSEVNNGYVFVYALSEQSLWEQIQVLSTDVEFSVFADFGSAVVVDGNRALIGAAGSEEVAFNAGSVYVYERNAAGIWEEQDLLLGSGLDEFSAFGGSIALVDDIAVIASSAPYNCSRFLEAKGRAVYIFKRDLSSGLWRETQRLESSFVRGVSLSNRFSDSEWFGSSVAFDGETLLIGATGPDALAQAAGVVYVFRQDANQQWVEQDRLVASDGTSGSQFGSALSLSEGTAVVGQFCGNSDTDDKVHVFSDLGE